MEHLTAVLFPGQGSQSVGMLADLAAQFPIVHETFVEASDLLHLDLWALCQQGPADKLNETTITQPVVFTADMAIWRLQQQEVGVKPDFVAGHSLGEFSALVVSDALSFADALQLVVWRSSFMANAIAVGEGAMAAVVGMDNTAIDTLCDAEAHGQVLSAANYNSPGQVVVAGHKAAVDRLLLAAKAQGAKLAVLIPVSVPSHCSLMHDASRQFQSKLEDVSFSLPQVPLLHNVDAQRATSIDTLKAAIVRQMEAPVQWVQTIQWLVSQQVTDMVECGPGKVLAGLNKRIDRRIVTHNLSTCAGFLAYQSSFNKVG